VGERSGPDEIAPADDAGADTAERYTYQHRYTATIACGLLVEDLGLAEVYCEHHEDLLVKRANGKYRGVQVKTRQAGLELWKSTSPEMLAALSRFAKLEQQFGDHFEGFTIATNHQFFRAKKTAANLPYAFELARAQQNGEEPKALAPLVKALAKAAVCSPSVALRTLAKCECDDAPPKLSGIRRHLAETISSVLPSAAETSYRRLLKLADALTAEVSWASSHQHKQCTPLFLSLASPGRMSDAPAQEAVENKRFTAARVASVLEGVLSAPELLGAGKSQAPRPLAAENSPMVAKLIAADFSAVAIATARDLHSEALEQHLQWANKYGEAEAIKRYHHLAALVQSEATISYEEARKSGRSFGIAMLKNLIARIQERRAKDHATVFGCTQEHLLGYAYHLTDACKVWWSEPFRLDEGE
jgi:hypothetical protein